MSTDLKTPPTDNPAVMPLEEVVKGLETLRLYECGNSNRALANLYDAALHHLEAGKRDAQKALDLRMSLAMAYSEGFKDGCHCYCVDPSPEAYLDRNWSDSSTKKLWLAALPTHPQPKGEA